MKSWTDEGHKSVVRLTDIKTDQFRKLIILKNLRY